MIVKMKKVSIITTATGKQECLETLRRLGVVHIETAYKESDASTRLLEQREQTVQAIQLVSPFKAPPEEVGNAPAKEGAVAIKEILALATHRQSLAEEITGLKNELVRLEPWGELDPASFRYLEEKGLSLHLFELPEENLAGLETDYILLGKVKKRCKILLVSAPGTEIPEDEFVLPTAATGELREQLAAALQEQERVEEEIREYLVHLPDIKTHLRKLEKALEFEQVALHMEEEVSLAVLTGFVPADQAEEVKKTAATQGWGTVVSKPEDDDPVPTLIRTPKWIGIVKPVFDMLGTVPGYREYDISFWFLLFFSLFFAMIIGDGGYGVVMLVLTIVAWLKLRKAPGSIFALLYVMCASTIVWGALSGTWFGSEAIASLWPFRLAVIPALSSVPSLADGIDTAEFIMNFCFVLGAIHLSIARLTNFFKRFPHLTSFAELGWLVMLWGLYFLIRNIVLQKEIYFLTSWLIGIGFALVIIFAEQRGNFFKGLGMGLARSLLKALDAIGGFSDIISYVRLYAVGLATVEVAKAWNILAAGIGFNSIVAGLIAGMILFAGHALNIVMGAMSIVVHGVRLNMLEFSGHLGMEWSGREYNPFRE